jgi:hypothetical protein
MSVARGTCQYSSYMSSLASAHFFYLSYYSAGTSGTYDNQRIHVLKGSSSTIWDSKWTYACQSILLRTHAAMLRILILARITIPNRDVWSIDGAHEDFNPS